MRITKMKKFNFIYGAAVASIMLFASCSNDQPEFNDADAFIAFTNTSLSVDEFGGSIDVPVLLTSLAGLEGTAVIEVDSTSTAKEGVHFTLPESNTITFTKDAPTQNFNIQIIDNDEFGGDKKIVLKITAVTGVNMGAVSTCVVTIADNEHPLKPILGKYNAYADTGRGEYNYEVLLTMDESDVQKVWICDIEPYFASYGYVHTYGENMFYGIVNEDLTQITIPAKQKLGYENVEMVLIDVNSGNVIDGDIIVSIKEGGKILEFETPWGVYDEGWWNYSFVTTLTKQ